MNLAHPFEAVAELLGFADAVSPAPTHAPSFPAWKEEADDELALSSDYVMTRKEEESFRVAKRLGFELLEQFLGRATNVAWSSQSVETRRAHAEALLLLPQIPQRTPAWYAQGKEVLTASEFATLFGSPRAWSQLVMSKVPPTAQSSSSMTHKLACLTCEMGPFDWGIRFEPVVKQYLERIWGTRIAESGRLLHPTDSRLAASPDGLILDATDPKRVGRLIEIKCPITRKVGVGVPFEYWCQMQLQMEVTGVDECEYVEVKLDSIHKMESELAGGAEPDGFLWLVQNPSSAMMAYAYTEEERATAEADGWDVLEDIPWRAAELWTKTVPRDRVWFSGTDVLREKLWDDIASARVGAFTVPEPVRARTAKLQVIVQKENTSPPKACLIVDE